jgi:hypothetical protein
MKKMTRIDANILLNDVWMKKKDDVNEVILHE